MDDTALKQRVLGVAVRDGARLRLACAHAHRLAAELGIDVRRIGAICHAESIKIVHCQLGCFGERKHE